jgi:hypothetical protein
MALLAGVTGPAAVQQQATRLSIEDEYRRHQNEKKTAKSGCQSRCEEGSEETRDAQAVHLERYDEVRAKRRAV